MNERVNEGWRIILAIPVGDYEFVLGYNKNNTCTPFVTWECNNLMGEPRYYWGHYFKTDKEAVADLISRANPEMTMYCQLWLRINAKGK